MKISSHFPAANGKISIAPSILSADLFNLGEEIRLAEKSGADWLHIDIMDGHFVPNLSFGPAVVRSLKGKTALPLDVHLMVEKPTQFLEPFVKAGAELLTVHLEAQDAPLDTLRQIRQLGIKAGISIKPDTDPKQLIPVLDEVDLVLVMCVYPGFGGQSFLPDSPARIKQVRTLINASGKPVWLEVDGGINAQTAPVVIQAGADALVAGNAIFSAGDPVSALRQIRQASADI